MQWNATEGGSRVPQVMAAPAFRSCFNPRSTSNVLILFISPSYKILFSCPKWVSARWMVEMGVEHISLEKMLRTRWLCPGSGVYRFLLQAAFCFFLCRELRWGFQGRVIFILLHITSSFVSYYNPVWLIGYKTYPSLPLHNVLCQPQVPQEILQLEPHLLASHFDLNFMQIFPEEGNTLRPF